MGDFDLISELREAAARQLEIMMETEHDPIWLNPEQRRCEALVQGLAAYRTDDSLQCSRPGFTERYADIAGEYLCGAFLCGQHAEMAVRHGELELFGRRLLRVKSDWPEAGWLYRPIVSEIIENYLNPNTVRRQRVPGREPNR